MLLVRNNRTCAQMKFNVCTLTHRNRDFLAQLGSNLHFSPPTLFFFLSHYTQSPISRGLSQQWQTVAVSRQMSSCPRANHVPYSQAGISTRFVPLKGIVENYVTFLTLMSFQMLKTFVQNIWSSKYILWSFYETRKLSVPPLKFHATKLWSFKK